jgi:hypothetical protein
MYTYRLRIAAVLLAAGVCPTGFGLAYDPGTVIAANDSSNAPLAKMPKEELAKLHRLICPQPEESKWARLPWMWNLMAARMKAVETDKPLLFWRAGGGDPLGRA